MHRAMAGPGGVLHAADSTPPSFEITIVAPGQVTAAKASPGLQLRSQLLLGAQVSLRTRCKPVDPAGPGGPGGPPGPSLPGWPAGPCGPAAPCGPAGPCGPEQPTSANTATATTTAND